jgi:hypothetical protein
VKVILRLKADAATFSEENTVKTLINKVDLLY